MSLKFGKPEEGWSKLRAYDSLEDVVNEGKSYYDTNNEPFHTTIRHFPKMIIVEYQNIRKKHKNIKSFRSFTFYTTKAGCIGIWDLSSVKPSRVFGLGYELGYEMNISMSEQMAGIEEAVVNDNYYADEKFGSRKPTDIWMFFWVENILREVAEDNYIRFSTVVIASILKGLSMSKRWIPKRRVEIYKEKYKLLEDIIKDRRKDVSRLLETRLDLYIGKCIMKVMDTPDCVEDLKRKVKEWQNNVTKVVGDKYNDKFERFYRTCEVVESVK